MEEDEDRPAAFGRVALWGEGANGDMAEREVLDLRDLQGLRSAEDSRLLTDGRVPGDLMEVRGVCNVLAVEGGILIEELPLDFGVDGLEDGALLRHG